jgi:hypothetical protein
MRVAVLSSKGSWLAGRCDKAAADRRRWRACDDHATLASLSLFSYATTPTSPSVQLLTLPTCSPRLASPALCLTIRHSLPQLPSKPRLKHRLASLPPSNLLETWKEAHAACQTQTLRAALLITLKD